MSIACLLRWVSSQRSIAGLISRVMATRIEDSHAIDDDHVRRRRALSNRFWLPILFGAPPSLCPLETRKLENHDPLGLQGAFEFLRFSTANEETALVRHERVANDARVVGVSRRVRHLDVDDDVSSQFLSPLTLAKMGW